MYIVYGIGGIGDRGGHMDDGDVPIPASDEHQRRLQEKLRREMGPTVCGYLADPKVIEIMLNPDGQLWVERLGAGMEHVGGMSSGQAEALIGTVAAALRTTVTRERPVLECELPLDGSRFEAVISPVVSSPAFAIRKPALLVFSLSDYVENGIITERQRVVIEEGVRQRKNILVVGGTSTGKTTLTNAILRHIAETMPQHRVVVIEDTSELQCLVPNHVMFRTSHNVNQLRLLQVCMRMRPDRICVGEVRGPEALALLNAWNTGHPGGVCTVHANSARAGLTRLEQLIAEATAAPMGARIAEAIDLIVSITRTPTGRRVEEVLAVNGFSDGEYDVSEV